MIIIPSESSFEKFFVNMENIDSVYISYDSGKYLLKAYNGNNDSRNILGKYRTELEAETILNDIRDKFAYYLQCKCGFPGVMQPQVIYQIPDYYF